MEENSRNTYKFLENLHVLGVLVMCIVASKYGPLSQRNAYKTSESRFASSCAKHNFEEIEINRESYREKRRGIMYDTILHSMPGGKRTTTSVEHGNSRKSKTWSSQQSNALQNLLQKRPKFIESLFSPFI